MLFDLVNRVCNEIDQLSPNDAIPALKNQLQQAVPQLSTEFRKQTATDSNNLSEADATTLLFAIAAVGCIKSLPSLIRRLVTALNDTRLDAARRCAVASVLAYFVQPHDIIPDNAPGGYGFLDDVIFVRAGLVEYLNTLPQEETSLEYERNLLGFLITLTPPTTRPILQQGIATMSLSVQILSLMEGAIAELMIAQIVSNPLLVAPPVAPQGFIPRATADYASGRWSGGAYFEGNSVVIPGGPSLIDGKLFVP